jgi:RNA-directed DNA polymerase
VHRALLTEIGPHFERRFIETHFTRGAGVGVHQAVLAFLAANRRFPFRLRLDIRRYFPSVRHAILERLLFREIRDRRVRWLIQQILRSGTAVYRSALARRALGTDVLPLPARSGIPLGSWFSQWAGAFYLDGLDHYVKRTLKMPAYLRYMDDFVLFAERREDLLEARCAVESWLAEQRALGLNPRHDRVEPTHSPVVFLGYRVSRAGIGPSRKLRRRMRARIAGAADRGPEALERTLWSYRGMVLF